VLGRGGGRVAASLKATLPNYPLGRVGRVESTFMTGSIMTADGRVSAR
jgi:hypothetical protein